MARGKADRGVLSRLAWVKTRNRAIAARVKGGYSITQVAARYQLRREQVREIVRAELGYLPPARKGKGSTAAVIAGLQAGKSVATVAREGSLGRDAVRRIRAECIAAGVILCYHCTCTPKHVCNTAGNVNPSA